jgi:hypothetical protein
MSKSRDDLAQIIAEREPESAADGLAEVVEDFVNFGGSEDDYFQSILSLPSPLRELYAALIFNTAVGSDGLPCAIPIYSNPEFVDALRDGLRLLGEHELLQLLDRAREHLRSESSEALRSNTPNVTFQREAPDLVAAYMGQRKALMPKIGEYLKTNSEAVLSGASRLDDQT